MDLIFIKKIASLRATVMFTHSLRQVVHFPSNLPLPSAFPLDFIFDKTNEHIGLEIKKFSPKQIHKITEINFS